MLIPLPLSHRTKNEHRRRLGSESHDADDLATHIETLDLKNATLVGHSTGGGEVAHRGRQVHIVDRLHRYRIPSAFVPGISLPVVRVGGGLIVIATGWAMLKQREDKSAAEKHTLSAKSAGKP
jgi:hypothetical protein